MVIWGIVALVVVVVAVLVFTKQKDKDKTDQKNPANYGKVEKAQDGKLVDGFAPELTQGSTVVESYAIPYDGADQYTANLTSDKSVADVVKGYMDYFNKNKFYQPKQTVLSPTAISIFTLKEDTGYTVVVEKPDPKGKTMITVSVLKH